MWLDSIRIDQGESQQATPVAWEGARFEDLVGLEINRMDFVGPVLQSVAQPTANNLVIDGTGNGMASVWLNRVLVDNTSGNGISILNINYLNANWVESFQNLGSQIILTNVARSELSNIFAFGCAGFGLTGCASGSNGLTVVNSSYLSVSNLVSYYNTGIGVSIFNTTDSSFSNVQANNNGSWGFLESGTSNRNLITGAAFDTNTAGDLSLSGAQSAAMNYVSSGTYVSGSGIANLTGANVWTNVAAPSTPASGKTVTWTDLTNKIWSAKNDAGTVSNTVVPSAAGTHQFANSISAAGVIGYAQPSFADLTSSLACSQTPALTGDVTTSAGACATAIGTNKVTRAMQAQGVARSVVGVAGNATANVADIQGAANQFFGVNSAGTGLGFETMSQDCTLVSGVITCTKTNNVPFTAGATAAAGQLPGEPSTGTAAAGKVGEIIESVITSTSPVSLANASTTNVTSISLTAGDWDIDCACQIADTASTVLHTYDIVQITSVSGTSFDATNNKSCGRVGFGGNISANSIFAVSCSIPPVRVSISSTTTYFLNGFSSWTGAGSATVWGILRARRAR